MTCSIWNNRFSKSNESLSKYDGWLDKHQNLLDRFRSFPCIDLGCGSGNDSEYLNNLGMNVFSMDFSINAINRTKLKNPQRVFLADIRSLPISNNSIGVVIANLSLHYFDELEMSKIGYAIRAIILPRGYLILRVNSIKDIKYGANGKHMNIVDGISKYFYTIDILQKYLNMFSFESMSEYATTCYGEPKQVIEGTLLKVE